MLPRCLVVNNPPASAGMQEMQVRSPGQEGPLEEEMAAHFSILAWKTPWTKGPVGLQSMRVTKSQARLSEPQQYIHSLRAYHSPVMLNCFLCDLI